MSNDAGRLGATGRVVWSSSSPVATSANLAPKASQPPTAWMLKQGGEFVRVTRPPELGTTVYPGQFRKEVISGGYDFRGEKNADTIKWHPVGELHSEPYDGAGDPNMTTFAAPTAAGPNRFLVRENGEFVELTRPPPAGTEIFTGSFQKRVTSGRTDIRHDPIPDQVRWLPAGDVTSQIYRGAGADESSSFETF